MVIILALKKLSALETIYFKQPAISANAGKNNGFTTND